MADTIAGFPRETWDKFLRPIDRSLIAKDPNKLDYVKHQVCIGMLNECFGVDGWRQEIVETWMQPEYPYKGGEKTGRGYAEAQVRLTIHKPGSEDPPVVRDNIGSQVAGADWSETRKGAVSEALKRAASLLGWAGNVYKTEAFNDWEERQQSNGNGGSSRRLEQPEDTVAAAQFNPDGTPANAEADLFARQAATKPMFPDPDAVVDMGSFAECMTALGITQPEVVKKAQRAAGLEECPLDSLDVDALRHIYAVSLEKTLQKRGAA